MKNQVGIAIFLSSVSFTLVGQNWQGIAEFNGYAEHLAVDSVNNVLYIAGGFNKINNTLNVQGICKYDGNSISTIDPAAVLPDFQEEFPIVQDIAVYQGDLYVASHSFLEYGSIEGTPTNGQVMRFDGEQWESAFPDIQNCQSLQVLNGKLYMFCYWGIGIESTEFIYVYDGEELQSFLYGTPYPGYASSTNGFIRDILEVDSGYILAGDMLLTTLNNESKWLYLAKDVYYWDGESEVEVFFNEGLNSMSGAFGNNVARRILRYQGEIYVGGAINSFGNVNGTGVVRPGENGTWQSLTGEGGGTSPHVQSMIVHDGLLWIVGNLLEYREAWGAEPMNLSDIMVWNGEQAFRPSDDVFPYPSELFDIVAFQDTVYVAGAFEFVNVTPTTSVAKFTGTVADPNVSVTESARGTVRIFPNPCDDLLRFDVQQEAGNLLVTIHNLSGQHMESIQLMAGDNRSIDISHLSPGIYVLQVMNGNEALGTEKLVVQ